MSIPNGVLLHIVFFLFLASLLSPKWVVHGESNTKRPDPLRHLKNYNGTFNIQSKDYWASAAFTGLYGYIIAGVWLLCGMGFAIFLTFKHPNTGNWRIKHFLDRHSILMFLLVLLFTLLAIVASSSVLAVNHSSMKGAEKLKRTIFSLAESASQTISKVTKVMRKMEYILLPYDKGISMSLNKTSHQLGKGLRSIQTLVDNNSHTLNQAIQAPYIAHLVIVTVNLVVLVVAIDDSCSALEEFERNDNNNTLSSILPCLDPKNSDALLAEIGSTIYNFIDKLNSKVVEFSRLLGMNEQNADFAFLRVCNPFSEGPKFSYEPERCLNSHITIEKLPDAIAGVTCYDDQDKEACKRSGRLLPHTYYNMASAYSQSIQEFLKLYPTLQSLAYCTFVKDGISEVVRYQCRPIKLAFRLLWASILSLAIFMVFLVVLLVARALQEKGRDFTIFTITLSP
ncbi:hypothetical protein RchiOBHm_Chr2g0108061 [Rosa chinensis]|uniref:Uncharacterized protein n=1 Tax=Rosa chinensis TaxID=74649 RepID=A0A2P6RP79_ROSCH|nr:hypothetical protein RchiOBHm_Chr2g0108061 [Rosa chinensis]